MKKGKVFIVLTALVFALSSCTTVYEVAKLSDAYEHSIVSKFDKAKAIQVYYNESDVSKPYETISLCSYKPLSIPILAPFKKGMTKNMVAKAVSAAINQGGNAVIIQNWGYFKVIKTTE